MTRFSIKKEVNDCCYEEYVFWVDENHIFLDKYFIMAKPLNGRKFRIEKFYDRVNSRESNLTEAEVPFSNSIKAEAIEIFAKELKCLKWLER